MRKTETMYRCLLVYLTCVESVFRLKWTIYGSLFCAMVIWFGLWHFTLLSAVINCMLTSTSAVGHSAYQGRPIGTKCALSHFYVSPFIHTFASTFALPTFTFYTYFALSRFIPARQHHLSGYRSLTLTLKLTLTLTLFLTLTRTLKITENKNDTGM